MPLSRRLGGERIVYAYALTDSDKVAYSKPVVIEPGGSAKSVASVVGPTTALQVPFVNTRGTFDDFVDDSAEASRNPYSAADVSTATLPASRIPYYSLALDEGVGDLLNDAATGQQYGRARVEGDYEWIAGGHHGGALKLGLTGKIRVRSKSWPYGAVTASAWVRSVSSPQPSAGSAVSIGSFRIAVRAGKIAVAQRFTGLTAEGVATFVTGWNHIALVYDFSTLTVYVNGKPVAKSATSTPVIQRSHWVPEVSIGADGKAPALLDGAIDQIEVIGTSLSAADVKLLGDRGQWMDSD